LHAPARPCQHRRMHVLYLINSGAQPLTSALTCPGTTRTPVPLPAGTHSTCVAAFKFQTNACTCPTLSKQTHARALPYQLRHTATHLGPDMSRYNMHASATASWHTLNVCRCLRLSHDRMHMPDLVNTDACTCSTLSTQAHSHSPRP